MKDSCLLHKNQISTTKQQQQKIMKLTVHHLDHSQSFRVVWLLEELKSLGVDVEHDLKLYKRNPHDLMAPEEFKALSPLGTAPTITTDTGLVMNESNAIIEYILDLAGEETLRPPASSPDRASFLFWFHAVQGTMQPVLTVDFVFRHSVKKTPWPISSIVKMVGSKVREALVLPRLAKLFQHAEQQLSQKDHLYLAGKQFTAADISAVYPFVSAFSRYPEYAKTYPNTKAWMDRVLNRPAYKAAQSKVGEEDGTVLEA